ncbi:MAG: glucose-6-phosphate isomerase [Tannerellaceae bacterium]|nr:glucose-6-phosphate isomerase [Tannerellaceae bacterium]
MNKDDLILPQLFFTGNSLVGNRVEKITRNIKDLKGIFQDEAAFQASDPEQVAYEVSSHMTVAEGTPGGLYFGITYLYPGKIGNEYMMTKGHYHANIDRAEYYWGLTGEGMLIYMDSNRKVWGEKMFPGSLHYIPGGVAHRVANTGSRLLSFAACWPSDAGHNYEEITVNGFARRLVEINGVPNLI